jgi:hypothetical protein
MGVQRFEKSKKSSVEEEEEVEETEEEEEQEEEEEEDPEEEESEEEESEDEEEEAPKKGKPKPSKAASSERRPKVELTKAEKRALFKAYSAAEQELSEHREKTEALEDSVKACIRHIAEQLGEGPFLWNGEKLRVVRRSHKEKGELIYFRKEAAEVEEI